MKKCFILLLIILFIHEVKAKCPDIFTPSELSKLPLCPEGSGANLLPETYPVGAFVVSNAAYEYDPNFTADVVEKVLKASGDSNPLILLPVNEDTLSNIKSRIDNLNASKEQKEKWKASLRKVDNEAYTWQQDFMQPYVNFQTGQIVIREVQGYSNSRYGERGVDAQKVVDAGKECGVVTGQKITSSDPRASGTYGGNIESLPGGICLLGRDHFRDESLYDEYVKNACGDSSKHHIKVPTSWLRVGHTDEIMKVVRNKNQAAPCDFSVVLASPKKGLELLKENPNAQFLKFPPKSYELPKHVATRRSQKERGVSLVCRKNFELKEELRTKRNREDNSGNRAKGVSKVFDLIDILYPKAFAGVVLVDHSERPPEDCTTMTNGDVYSLFTQNNDLKDYNKLVQGKMDELKSEIQSKLKERLPQCNIDFIEAPDLFYGGPIVEPEKGGKELPNQSGLSVLPNPTNAITINDTIISPEPSNDIFKSYLEEEYKKRGLKTEFVDTFDYAHIGQGNLHCSTNTMHVCRPRGK